MYRIRDRITLNRLSGWCLAAFFVFQLAACTPAPETSKITISGPFEPINQDPASTGYIFTRMQVLETLVEVSREGKLIPGLAKSWHNDATHTRWQFSLRHGVTFHDGSPMDATAVAQSLSIALGKPTPFDKSIFKQINVLASDQIEIVLHHAYRPLPSLLTNYTTAILAPSSFGQFNRIKTLNGTGPYQLSEFEPPHHIQTKKFAQYWGTPAHIDEAEYITGHRSETRALMVQSGQADIVYNLDAAAARMLASSDSVRVYTDPIPRTTLIKLNAGDPRLSDKTVRQALSLALDRSGIATGVLRLPGTEANQLFGPALQQWHIDSLAPVEQDLTAARALLDQAGWRLNKQGVREKAGTVMNLSMITYANRPELMAIATAIQDQWAQIGVKLNVQMENVSAIPSGHADGSLQTALMARNFSTIPDPMAILLADFSDKSGGEWGPMNFSDPVLFKQVTTLPDMNPVTPEARTSIVRQLTQSLPVIPVVFYVQRTATSGRLKNFTFDPFERSFHISQMQLAPSQ